MDPVTAIGFASSVLAFIEVGVKVVKTTNEIRNSLDGSTKLNATRRTASEELTTSAERLGPPGDMILSPEQEALCKVARECQGLSKGMLDLLERVKPSKSSRIPGSALRGAVKAIWKQDDFEDFESQLSDCRVRLTLSLVELFRVESIGFFDQLLSSAKNDATKLEELLVSVKQLRQGVRIEGFGVAATEQLKRLMNVDEEALDTLRKERILNCLDFEGKGKRLDEVRQPHMETFNWMFEDTSTAIIDGSESPESSDSEYEEDISDDVLEMQNTSRETFLGWLASPDTLFHIHGKLGSGKSTLMKFLSSHPRTRSELERWAGPKKLIITNFFFWRPGSDLQKSIQGLCRSLLYDLLRERPELIPETMGVDWEQAARSTWRTETKMDIPADSIRDALWRLVQNKRLYEDHRFCFFIDGLDEHENTHHSDYHDLVKQLRIFSDAADGRLKLCLSSREENVFMAAYSDTPSLRLHELTWFDMRKYVLDRLEHLQDHRLKFRLADMIPRRAEGIFFWTSLAVGMVRAKLADGESGEELEAHLNTLPSGLRALFEHILDRLDDANKRKTYRVVTLMELSDLPSLSLLAFSFLDEYDKDAQFSTGEHYAASASAKNRSKMNASQKLHGACGGLIVHHDKPWMGKPWGELSYAHRSVPELFKAESIKQRMEASLKDFDAMDAMFHLMFAEVQFLGDTEESRNSWSKLIRLRLRCGLDQPPYTLLERFASWIDDAKFQHIDPDFQVRNEYNGVVGWTAYTSHTFPHDPDDRPTQPQDYSALLLAAQSGAPGIEYILWKLRNDPAAMDTPFKQAIVARVILHYWERSQDAIQTLQPLFESGFFTKDVAVTFLRLSRFGYVESESINGEPLTIWQRYQIETCGLYQPGDVFVYYGNIMERFLRSGVDPSMTITVEIGEELGEEEEEGDETYRYESFEKWEFRFKNARAAFTAETGTKILQRMAGFGERHRNRAVYSFRDFIQASHFGNKDCLLALMDSRQGENHEVDGKTSVDDVGESGDGRGEERGSRIGPEPHDRIECEDQSLVEAEATEDQLGGNDLTRGSRVPETPNIVPMIVFGVAICLSVSWVWMRLNDEKGDLETD